MKYIMLVVLLCYSFASMCQINDQVLVVEYKQWNKSRYAFIRNVKPNLPNAQAGCKSIGMHLVKIDSEEENRFIEAEAFSKEGVKFTDGNQYWLGASDHKTEGQWLWLSDKSMFYDEKTRTIIGNAYNQWGQTTLGGQPNNVSKNDEDEDCAVIRPGGEWFDIGCSKRFAYVICEAKTKD